MADEHEAVEGEQDVDVKEDTENKECLICLDIEKDTVIMPCGHLCIDNVSIWIDEEKLVSSTPTVS